MVIIISFRDYSISCYCHHRDGLFLINGTSLYYISCYVFEKRHTVHREEIELIKDEMYIRSYSVLD